MPKTKELVELFRAIGSHDLSRAAWISKKLAAQHGTRGQYRAERDLLGALNGAANLSAPTVTMQAAWSVTSSLMPLPLQKKLDDLELPAATKLNLREITREWNHRALLEERSIPRRWRLLFHGPSGCGKSATAAALAAETKLPGYLVRFDSLIGAYLGQTALRLRELFRFAEQTPCVLLFDEVDALAKKRGSPMEVGELDRIVIAFMQELEHAHGEGFVVATSNLPDALDVALWRRFDFRVSFPRPSTKKLDEFSRHLASKWGFKADRETISSCRNSESFAEAEQLVIAEARRRVLNSA